MKIAIINQPTNNRGDEAAHRSLVRNLNAALPEAQLSIIFIGEKPDTIKQMSVVSSTNSYINIPKGIKGTGRFFPKVFVTYNMLFLSKLFKSFHSYISILKKSDLVICAPGGICMGGFQNWPHIFFLLLALRYNKNVFYYSRSIGPFSEKTYDECVFKKRSIEILNKLNFIALRDNRSMKVAEQLGVSYKKTTDAAFLDIPDASLSEELLAVTKNDYFVFVPNSLSWHPAYRNASQDKIDSFYIKIGRQLLEKHPKNNIVMLPQLFNNLKICDEIYFNSLKMKMNSDRVIILSEKYSSDIQQKIISGSKMVVGARYHSIVFAINNGINFVALSYEHKIAGLLDMLNLSDRSVDLSKLGKNNDDDNSILENAIRIMNEPIEPRILDNAKNTSKIIAQKCFRDMIKKI